MRPPPLTLALALGLALVTACGAQAAPSTEPGAAAALEVAPPSLADGVTAMERICREVETCDALDADCDGHVDEGCEGVAPGALEVAVAWNGPADLDLLVEAPDGSTEGARTEAGCDGPRVERRAFEALAEGRHAVRLRHADACGADAPITASVTVAAHGEVLGTFNRAVAPGAEVDVLELSLRAVAAP